MMSQQLLPIRDAFSEKYKGVQGFTSAGFKKRNGELVIVAAIDSTFTGGLPESYEGLAVVTENLGIAHAAIMSHAL